MRAQAVYPSMLSLRPFPYLRLDNNQGHSVTGDVGQAGGSVSCTA